MSPVTARAGMILAAGALLLASACSDGRSSGQFNADTGTHGKGWLPAGHSAAVLSTSSGTSQAGSNCAGCHGADLGGGISGVSCTSCHLGGPTAVHPREWQPVSQAHAAYAGANGTASCSNLYCHGQSLEGVAGSGPSCSACHLGGPAHLHPQAWTVVYRDHGPYAATSGTGGCAKTACHGNNLAGVAGSGPSCTSCHMGGPTTIHPAAWTLLYQDHGPFVNSNGTAGCANQVCHGQSLAGVAGSGPSCEACHSWPFTPGSVSCAACHQSPPNGTAFPNRAGKHAKHVALANVTCSTCHNGAGGDTVNSYHMNGTPDVIFLATFNSKSGSASYDAATKTCSNVSCHGGPRTQTQTQAVQAPPQSTKTQTPSWLTGAINVNTDCKSCHVYGTAEYNGYWSGQHRKHVYDKGKECIDCHDAAKLGVNHFTTLNTSTLEGPASDTLRTQLQYISTPPKSCNPYAGGLITGCHPDATPENW